MRLFNKTRFFLLLIIIISTALRIFYLGKIPNGFYSDEAAYGYNAYSLLKTARDEYGSFLPVAFKSFGDYKAPLYIYFMVPFIGVFGLTEWSVRFSAAVLGIGSIILIYYLTRELFKKQSLALLSALFASISPFSLQFNRMAHENNLVVFLILLGLVFFIKSLKSANYIFLSITAFILSIYTYHDARIFTPLFILALIVIYRRQLNLLKKKLLWGLLLALLLLLPFINLLRTDAFWSRPKFTIISSDPGIGLRINDERGEDIKTQFFSPTLFHNKVISYTLTFMDNYFKHYSFNFLFLMGDPVKIYQTVGNGILYLITLPFIIYGIYYLFRYNLNHKWLIFSWLILAPVPSALTRFVPSASRIFSIQPVFAILTSLGLYGSLKIINNLKIKRLYIKIIVLLLSINIAYYLHYYYFNTNLRYAKEWHFGMKEVIAEVEKRQDNFAQVWFSKNAWGYSYPLFYLKYPPEKYQTQARLTALNQFGFGWVDSFDKYIFADIGDISKLSSNTLYVGAPQDFANIKKPLYTVYYPDGQVAFYLVDKSSF